MNNFFKRFLIVAGIGLVLFALSRTTLVKKLIKQLEGFSATPYRDSAGYWTIGYGHKIIPGDPYYTVDTNPSGTIHSITEAEGDALLDQDMAPARNAVLAYSRVPLNENQIDALTSFVYNVGQNAFANSTLLRKLNDGDFNGAADEFMKWIHAGGKVVQGLVNRRATEKELFLSA